MMNSVNQMAVVGASGFVGTQVIARLADQGPVIALSRSEPKHPPANVSWRKLDLFSAQSAFDALKGVKTAIYLIHSMMPSSRLFQGDFHDVDLLLADNFARACTANGVQKIIYVGGVMPEDYVSPHLQSRFEVEQVLKATGIPTTVLRAGMIVGPGGSSFEILRTLVQRLPFMVLPEWTKRSTQAIFIDDVVAIIAAAVTDSSFAGQTIDVVNGERLDYKKLLILMAQGLKRKPLMVSLPIQSTEFSKLWVRIFGNSTAELVSPLIDSLLCDLPALKPIPLIEPFIRYPSFAQMVAEALRRETTDRAPRPKRKILFEKSVRSIQRLPSVAPRSCHWVAEEYMNWLPRFLPLFVRVKFSPDHETIRFYLTILPWPLLKLRYIRGAFEDDRQKFHIVGGLLTKTTTTGWLEFRQASDKKYTLAAIHEFVPSLPWPIYVATQAPMHKWVMTAFGKHLEGAK